MGTLVLTDETVGAVDSVTTRNANNAALKALINGGLDESNLAAATRAPNSKLANPYVPVIVPFGAHYLLVNGGTLAGDVGGYLGTQWQVVCPRAGYIEAVRLYAAGGASKAATINVKVGASVAALASILAAGAYTLGGSDWTTEIWFGRPASGAKDTFTSTAVAQGDVVQVLPSALTDVYYLRGEIVLLMPLATLLT